MTRINPQDGSGIRINGVWHLPQKLADNFSACLAIVVGFTLGGIICILSACKVFGGT